jgi:hypothetical protein
MGNCFSSKTEPSVPTPEKTQSPQAASIPDGTTSTPSHRPGTATSARPRAQSKGAQRRHDDGGDNSPPWGNVFGTLFTSQYLDHQEMSRSDPSSGTGRIERPRHVSMNAAAQSAPSQSSSPRNRAASTVAGHGIGRQRVATKSMSGMSSATGQIAAGRQGGRSRLPSTLQSLLHNDFRYAVGHSPVSL